jgi:DNA-binding NarL/FixJ family response regulator
MIRVCVVDDQTLIRQGLCSLLALVNDVEVVAEASDGVEALEAIAVHHPDVVLLDLRMPKMDGLQVLEALVKRELAPPALILTTFDDDELVLKAIRLGAKGYLLKDVSLAQLTAAVRTLAQGGTFVKPAITERVLRGLSRLEPSASNWSCEQLTARETEILRMMAGGYSNKEIAQALFLAEGTVKNHISHILAKLGVRDRTRAVLKALELGWM